MSPAGAVFMIVSMVVIFAIVIISNKKKGSRSRLQLADLSPEKQVYVDIFKKYQHDWQEKNLPSIKTYTTPEYYKRAGLMLLALDQLHRKNEIEIGKIYGATIANRDDGSAAATFVCDATDILLDEKNGHKLNTNHYKGYTETWIFKKGADGQPLLDAINPATIAPHTLRAEMQSWAEQNKMFYSPDWGTLTLPRRGVIFASSTFRTADINNHCIGLYEGDLVQLYTYSPTTNVQVNGAPHPQYLVGQIAMPKSYGGILVMPNRLVDKKPRGYKKYQLEWSEFNKRYDVFATDLDKVASFELLNPQFMEFLHDKVDFKITLEVVDNIIYFYAKGIKNTRPENYKTMLEILRRAHKELKH